MTTLAIPEPMSVPEPAQAKPLIVVVDDDPAVRNSLKFSLELEGFAVRTYATGSAALADTASRDARCLVIDQNLPGMSGLDLLERLTSESARVPSILITTHPSDAVIARASKAGIAIVEKPLLGNVLLDAIRNALGRHGPSVSP